MIIQQLWPRYTKCLAGAALAMLLGLGVPAQAEDARKIVKDMSDYLAAQRNLSIRYDADTEVITPDLQKIQFTASGVVLIDRQAGLRVTRTGGYADVELVFDGNAVIVHNRASKTFAKIDALGTVIAVIEALRTRHGVEIPGADLFLSFDQLTEGVIDAKHIGQGIVDGVECEHLAFRNHDTDWQLWVQTGPRPVPRKYVVTSKTVAQAPQYTLRIEELRTDANHDPAVFAFKAAPDPKQVTFEAVGDIDEVPPGIAQGVSKP